MKTLFLFLGIIFFVIFTSSNYVQAGAVLPGIKTNVSSLHRHNQSKEIEGYYISEPMDGETESCNISLNIKKVQGRYTYNLNISGHVFKGKVKLTEADNPKERGIIFQGVKWAENNGDISRTAKQVKLKLPDSIEGVWSESGIIIQNYGNSMNNYMQIASCGQKYINLVKQ